MFFMEKNRPTPTPGGREGAGQKIESPNFQNHEIFPELQMNLTMCPGNVRISYLDSERNCYDVFIL